jgi:hypothetical protein
MMERMKIMPVLLSNEDSRVLMESLWHAVQRGDIPSNDRARAHALREKLGREFNVGGGTDRAT